MMIYGSSSLTDMHNIMLVVCLAIDTDCTHVEAKVSQTNILSEASVIHSASMKKKQLIGGVTLNLEMYNPDLRICKENCKNLSLEQC